MTVKKVDYENKIHENRLQFAFGSCRKKQKATQKADTPEYFLAYAYATCCDARPYRHEIQVGKDRYGKDWKGRGDVLSYEPFELYRP